MTTITFNTLAFTKRLQESGFDEKQAETVVELLAEAQETLVTSEHFDNRMAILESSLIIKMGAMIAAAVAMIVTLLKVL